MLPFYIIHINQLIKITDNLNYNDLLINLNSHLSNVKNNELIKSIH